MAEMETAAIPSADGDAGKLGLSQPAGGATKRPKRHAKAQWLLKKPNARLAHNPEVPFLVLYSRNMKSDACDNRRDTNTTQVSTVWGGAGQGRGRLQLTMEPQSATREKEAVLSCTEQMGREGLC